MASRAPRSSATEGRLDCPEETKPGCSDTNEEQRGGCDTGGHDVERLREVDAREWQRSRGADCRDDDPEEHPGRQPTECRDHSWQADPHRDPGHQGNPRSRHRRCHQWHDHETDRRRDE
jgi:hypothetical protein